MMGNPRASRRPTPGTTHDGNPTLTVRTHARPSTTAAASPNSTATRTGWPCVADGAGTAAAKGAVPAGVMPPGVLAPETVMPSSAWTSSSAVCGRSAGFFSRQRMMSAASAGGTLPRKRSTGCGCCVTCAAMMACADPASKGWRPQSISYATMPSA